MSEPSRSEHILSELRTFTSVAKGLLDAGGGRIQAEGIELLERVTAYIEKLDKIWGEGGEIIHARGYQIRGMMTAMGDQGRRIKQLERYMMYYRDHVLPEMVETLQAIADGPPEAAKETAAHALAVVERRRKPTAAREAVRKMEHSSLSYRRHNPDAEHPK